jgi:hypothetical protein
MRPGPGTHRIFTATEPFPVAQTSTTFVDSTGPSPPRGDTPARADRTLLTTYLRPPRPPPKCRRRPRPAARPEPGAVIWTSGAVVIVFRAKLHPNWVATQARYPARGCPPGSRLAGTLHIRSRTIGAGQGLRPRRKVRSRLLCLPTGTTPKQPCTSHCFTISPAAATSSPHRTSRVPAVLIPVPRTAATPSNNQPTCPS